MLSGDPRTTIPHISKVLLVLYFRWIRAFVTTLKPDDSILISLINKVVEELGKGQQISQQNCRAITSPKNKRTNLFFYPDDSKILETWNRNSSFKYFRVVRIEKQIRPFVFLEKLRLDNFVSRYTDLYSLLKWIISSLLFTKLDDFLSFVFYIALLSDCWDKKKFWIPTEIRFFNY